MCVCVRREREFTSVVAERALPRLMVDVFVRANVTPEVVSVHHYGVAVLAHGVGALATERRVVHLVCNMYTHMYVTRCQMMPCHNYCMM